MICNHDYIYILNIESYICIFAIIQIDYLLSQILFIYEWNFEFIIFYYTQHVKDSSL